MKQIVIVTRDNEQAFTDAVNIELMTKTKAEIISTSISDNFIAIIQFEKDSRDSWQTNGILHCVDCKYFTDADENTLSGWCAFLGCNKRKDKKAASCKHFCNTYEGV